MIQCICMLGSILRNEDIFAFLSFFNVYIWYEAKSNLRGMQLFSRIRSFRSSRCANAFIARQFLLAQLWFRFLCRTRLLHDRIQRVSIRRRLFRPCTFCSDMIPIYRGSEVGFLSFVPRSALVNIVALVDVSLIRITRFYFL